jgi:predicted molibdopterin-dependent oxidoreductase YjgC
MAHGAGRHHLEPLHQRRNLSGAEAGARRFGNNNVDTCARVCHSPTGYGLADLRHQRRARRISTASSIADVILVIGANPTDAHPVFASRMKRACARARS